MLAACDPESLPCGQGKGVPVLCSDLLNLCNTSGEIDVSGRFINRPILLVSLNVNPLPGEGAWVNRTGFNVSMGVCVLAIFVSFCPVYCTQRIYAKLEGDFLFAC